MPYIHVTLATGRTRDVKRELIIAMTDAMEQVLEVTRTDIHVLLWELPTENIGEAGQEPEPSTTNNVMVLMAEGRPSTVKLVLIKSLTDVVGRVLQVARMDVHLVVLETPFSQIGEAGTPMEPPHVPSWYYQNAVMGYPG